MVSPVHGDYRRLQAEIPLIELSKLPRPALSLFHDRVSLVFHTVPHGYFSIFKEMSDIIVTLIRQGANIDDKFIPDISVGQHWANHWRDSGLELAHGERIQYEHNYPGYFPQSASNPQPAYCYPDSSLGEFRRWMRDVYLQDKMPTYLTTKARQGALPPPSSNWRSKRWLRQLDQKLCPNTVAYFAFARALIPASAS
jgi:hypothetical protein